jgi:hypothetical protein
MNQTFNCLFGSYSKLLVCANDISLDVSYAKRMTDCKQIKEVVVCNNYPLSYDNVVYENVHYAYGLFDQSHFTKDYKMFVIDNLGAKALYALDPVNFLYLLDFNAVTFEKLVSGKFQASCRLDVKY